MVLKNAFVRFYKSFNYDYLRKHRADNTEPHAPWETMEGAFYPYVRVTLDPEITTVVGANESGKSHLLGAIEKGVTGKGIKPEDFCRYSQFFSVRAGEVRDPDFGFEWSELSSGERDAVAKLCDDVDAASSLRSFYVFRTNGSQLTLYLRGGEQAGDYRAFQIEPDALEGFLPRVFRIDANIALPESVPLRVLADSLMPAARAGEALGRRGRFKALETVESLAPHANSLTNQQTFAQHAPSWLSVLAPFKQIFAPQDEPSKKEQRSRQAQIDLARDLICKVARVDPKAIVQLYDAIRDGNDGYANGIVEHINTALAERLNFPRIWAQDNHFALLVSPREHDLVFTIKDRTGTQYSFDERSSGLKYFLSYYIQYLAHESIGPEKEILLMDEPDAYLSSQAQQDLLKIFRSYAEPAPGRQAVQVVYVTHSPFLIDKNRAERIRVLEKGVGDEGTRVVRDAARNHYEPLRSAFGAFLGENTFIGNCNLMVEGQADQILLGGVSTFLMRRGGRESDALDLNRLTIVPAGSASHVPYLAYLARGRDIERPAVIVLLDSDEAGNQAVKDLRRGGPRGRQTLDAKFILQVAALAADCSVGRRGGPVEIEDLIPAELAVAAARHYAHEFWDAVPIPEITSEDVAQRLDSGVGTYDAVEAAANALGQHFDKVGFARAVVEVLPKMDQEAEALNTYEGNMRVLFRRLRAMQRRAEKELTDERVSNKVERVRRVFFLDNPDVATREQGARLMEDLEDSLDDESPEGDIIRDRIRAINREFSLNDEGPEAIEEYAKFKEAVVSMQYAPRIATQQP